MFRLSRLLIIDHRDKQTIKQRRVCDCEVKKKKKKERGDEGLVEEVRRRQL